MIKQFLKFWVKSMGLYPLWRSAIIFHQRIKEIREFGFAGVHYFSSWWLLRSNNFKNFKAEIDFTKQKAKELGFTGGDISDCESELLYLLLRAKKPEIVVETGVGPGGSSAYILKALNDNKKGKLISIDLPGFDLEYYPTKGLHADKHVPDGWQTGWLIPEKLKERWRLKLGDAKKELPKLLDTLKTIDVFLHDSLHTDEQMLFEYEAAFKYLSKGGLLLSHDVNEYWSLAFLDFCKGKNIRHRVFVTLGVGIK